MPAALFCRAFLSTLSLRRATRIAKLYKKAADISIHALLAESDGDPRIAGDQRIAISIHALLAESDLYKKTRPNVGHNFYPRSPCGERRGISQGSFYRVRISIHALLAESDEQWLQK